MHFFLFDSPETKVNNRHALEYMCYWLRCSFPRLLEFETARRVAALEHASAQQHNSGSGADGPSLTVLASPVADTSRL